MLPRQNQKNDLSVVKSEKTTANENPQIDDVLSHRYKIRLAKHSDSAEKAPSPLMLRLQNFFNPHLHYTGVSVQESGECHFLYYIFKVMIWRYFSIRGRASRKEFLAFWLFGTLVDLSCYYYFMWQLVYNPELQIADVDKLLNLINIISFLTIAPALTVTIRRAHDIGLSGRKLFIPSYKVLFLPFIKGDKGCNAFGAPE